MLYQQLTDKSTLGTRMNIIETRLVTNYNLVILVIRIKITLQSNGSTVLEESI